MTHFNPANPLIVQADHTVLVEVDSPRCEQGLEDRLFSRSCIISKVSDMMAMNEKSARGGFDG